MEINKVNLQNGEFDEILEWRNIKEIPEMVYDHNEILNFALRIIKKNLKESFLTKIKSYLMLTQKGKFFIEKPDFQL
nr:hypothetical protein [uncultured Emticicia sp.]